MRSLLLMGIAHSAYIQVVLFTNNTVYIQVALFNNNTYKSGFLYQCYPVNSLTALFNCRNLLLTGICHKYVTINQHFSCNYALNCRFYQYVSSRVFYIYHMVTATCLLLLLLHPRQFVSIFCKFYVVSLHSIFLTSMNLKKYIYIYIVLIYSCSNSTPNLLKSDNTVTKHDPVFIKTLTCLSPCTTPLPGTV